MEKLPDTDSVLSVVSLMRSGDDSPDTVQLLIQSIGGRKLVLKYWKGECPSYIFLTKATVWKLRSFLLNKGSRTFENDTTAEYLDDIFVHDTGPIELYRAVA